MFGTLEDPCLVLDSNLILNGHSVGGVASRVYEGLIATVVIVFRYSIGEPLAVNCTAEESQPPVNLTWYINQEPVCIRSLMNLLKKIFYFAWLLKLHSKLGNKCIWGI